MNAHPAMFEWPTDARDLLPFGLWDAASVAAATGGAANCEFQCSGVEIDSRDVKEGDLFFALKGESTDGHRFLDAAFANGAVAAVVDRPIDRPHVLVEDTTRALEALGAAARSRADAVVIGVTGSVGKTGVKEALFAALDRSSRGHAHRSVKSYNNHVGVPLSLSRMPARTIFGIFEMGMNHSGEIAALTRQVRPNVAVITTIAEIFEGIEAGGTAVIPADSPHFARLRDAALKSGAKVVSFGRAAHADVRLLDMVVASSGGSLVTVDLGDRRVCYTVSAAGDHWVLNSLAVMAAVRAAGGDLGAAGLALAEMGGLAGRGARLEVRTADGGQALLIDESYNANPASMRATLTQLGQTPAKRRIAVLGAMKELGDFSPAFHAALAQPIVDAGVDHVILVGDEMNALAGELGKAGGETLGKGFTFAHCGSCDEAIAALSAFGLKDGDAVLVKGSNSVGLARLVAHFSAEES
jgi:UDP-N-acetylmuramoyl-tripeptide--D-alanyl-D-alanine ligase